MLHHELLSIMKNITEDIVTQADCHLRNFFDNLNLPSKLLRKFIWANSLNRNDSQTLKHCTQKNISVNKLFIIIFDL